MSASRVSNRAQHLQRLVAGAVAAHIVVTWARAAKHGWGARAQPSPPTLPPRQSPPPKVSVLIPAWNEATTIGRCLASLREVCYPHQETIVIAGGPDGTYAAATVWADAQRHLCVIEQKPGGKNAALAQGLAHATGDVVVVLDADSVVECDWLQQLVRPLQHGAAASCGNYRPLRDTWVSAYEQMERIEANELRQARSLQGSGAIAIRRAALDAIGGFPTDIKVGVDWDIGVRLRREGYRIAFAPLACLSTDRPATLVEFWRNEVRWRRAHLWSLVEHRDWFFRNAESAFGSTAFLASTALSVAGGAAPAVLRASGHGVAASRAWRYWVLFLAWSAGRRAGLAIEVATFTGRSAWLRHIWAPPLLLLVSMAATVRAALTFRQISARFKGPRPPADQTQPPLGQHLTTQRRQYDRAL